MAFSLILQGSLGGGDIQLHGAGGKNVVALDLGQENREEVWIEPFGTEVATLAARTRRRTAIRILLQVRGGTLTQLISRMEDIRDKCQSSNLAISYSPDSPTIASRTITCYPSAIDPAPLGDPELYKFAVNQFLVPRWELRIWRQPSMASVGGGGTAPPVL